MEFLIDFPLLRYKRGGGGCWSEGPHSSGRGLQPKHFWEMALEWQEASKTGLTRKPGERVCEKSGDAFRRFPFVFPFENYVYLFMGGVYTIAMVYMWEVRTTSGRLLLFH